MSDKKQEYLEKAKEAGRQGDKEMYDYWMKKAEESEGGKNDRV